MHHLRDEALPHPQRAGREPAAVALEPQRVAEVVQRHERPNPLVAQQFQLRAVSGESALVPNSPAAARAAPSRHSGGRSACPSEAISSVSSRHRRQWSVARAGLEPSAIVPGRAAQSLQLLSTSPPSICVAAVATPSSIPSSREAVTGRHAPHVPPAADAPDWRRMGHVSVADHRAAVARLLGAGTGGADRPRPACRRAPPRGRPPRARRPPALRRLRHGRVCRRTRQSPGQRRYPVVGDVPAGSAPQTSRWRPVRPHGS